MGRGYTREAASDLPQTVEQLYHGALRVLKLHSPKSQRTGPYPYPAVPGQFHRVLREHYTTDVPFCPLAAAE